MQVLDEAELFLGFLWIVTSIHFLLPESYWHNEAIRVEDLLGNDCIF